jgi:hypothetical protein
MCRRIRPAASLGSFPLAEGPHGGIAIVLRAKSSRNSVNSSTWCTGTPPLHSFEKIAHALERVCDVFLGQQERVTAPAHADPDSASLVASPSTDTAVTSSPSGKDSVPG